MAAQVDQEVLAEQAAMVDPAVTVRPASVAGMDWEKVVLVVRAALVGSVEKEVEAVTAAQVGMGHR